MTASKYLLVDRSGAVVAEFLIDAEEEGWYTGVLLLDAFSPEVKQALAWYAEVVQYQMLSYLDEATAAVERWGLQITFPDGTRHPVNALHLTKEQEVSFRITPVGPLVRGTPQ